MMLSGTDNISKTQPVCLPKVPLGTRPKSATDEFWLQQGTSGAINAFRQLTHTKHRNGRKQISLPGGKLQPLFKNYSAPAGLWAKLPESDILPDISGQSPGVLDESMKGVIAGNISDLPELLPTMVRVYLASNEKDMKSERQVIMEKAVPDIQDYCAKQGLHFQLVDMPWPDVIDTLAPEIHKTEIEQCQKLSMGPNFIALVGDMIGPHLPPNMLQGDVYETLLATGVEKNVPEIARLQECYVLDQLAADPQYVLKTNLESRTLKLLVSVLRKTCQAAADSNNKFSDILKSGLESDIMQAITDTKEPRNYCLCFRREWQNMDFESENALQNYIDTNIVDDNKTVLDDKAYQNAQSMTSKLMEHIGVGNCRQYFLNHEEYIQGNTTEYEDYLENLHRQFSSDVKEMIKQGIEKQRHGKLLTVYKEALHHAHICRDHLAHFQGQEELLFSVEKLIKDPRRNFKPFVIHGNVGSGKSSVMAKISASVKSWFTQDSVVITRFMGTTHSASNIQRVLVSITQHICATYGMKLLETDKDSKTLFDTLTSFRNIIEEVSEKFSGIRPLVIVLDGIDQLFPIEESIKALWAICQMPSNVHIILSVVSQIGKQNLAEMLSSMVTDADSVQSVEALTRNDVVNLINGVGAKLDKTVTEDVKNGIIESCKLLGHLQDPLYLYHSVNVALRNGSEVLNAESASDILANTLKRMAEMYHPLLMKYISAYLTINPLGVHEREILDLLNSDTSLTTVLSKENSWLISSAGISTYAWAQIKHELRFFLRENSICEKSVLAWNHQTWLATVANLYGIIYPGIDESLICAQSTTFTLELHKNMANLYLGQTDEPVSGIPNMPQLTKMQNVMKLFKLPRHMQVLLPVDGLQNVKNNMFFNLEWLLAKIKAFSVQDILTDLQSAIDLAKQFGDEMELDQSENAIEDMQAMYEFLQLSEEGLRHNQDNLPAEIMARLPPVVSSYPAFHNLIKSVNDFVENTNNPCMMPVYPCLAIPNSPLRHSLDGPTHIVGLIQGDSLCLTFSQKYGVGLLRMETGELIHRFPVNAEQLVNGVLPTKGGEHVLIGHYSHINHVMDLEVRSVATGISVIKVQFPHKFEIMKLDACDEILLVSAIVDLGGKNKESQRCLLGIDIKSKEVVYTIPVTANEVHKYGISDMMFFQDSLNVLTVGDKLSKDLACWNLEAQELKWKTNLENPARFVEITSDKVVVMGTDGTLTTLSSESGETLGTACDPSISCTEAVYISKQGRHVLLGSGATGLTVMDLETTTTCKTIEFTQNNEGMDQISKITMDQTEQFIFVAYLSGRLDVISITTGERIVTLVSHNDEVTSLVCTDYDSMLLSASVEGKCAVWNLMVITDAYNKQSDDNNLKSYDGLEQFSLPIEKSDQAFDVNNNLKLRQGAELSDLCLVSSKQLLVTASAKDYVKIFDVNTGEMAAQLENSMGADTVYTAYKDKLLLAHTAVPGSGRVRNLCVWNIGTYDKVTMDEVLIYTSCLLPDDDRLFTISPNTEGDKQGIILGIYDLFEMKPVASLHCNISGEMNASNLVLLGVTTVKKPRPADVASKADTDLETIHYAVLDYSPNENTSFFFTFVIRGDQLSMDHVDPVYINTHLPSCTKVLKDGVVASGTLDGTIVLWSTEEHDIVGYLSDPSTQRKRQKDCLLHGAAHIAKITSISVSGDYKKLSSVSEDGFVKVWDLASRAPACSYKISSKPILTCDISHDGTLVAVGGENEQIILLSAVSNTKLASFYSYAHVTKVLISNDKQNVVAKCDSSSKIMLKTISIDL